MSHQTSLSATSPQVDQLRRWSQSRQEFRTTQLLEETAAEGIYTIVLKVRGAARGGGTPCLAVVTLQHAE